MRDAVGLRSEQSKLSLRNGMESILSYADDTSIYDRSQQCVQNILNAVATAGWQVGMELHWDKFQVMHVNNTMQLCTPRGE
eukprot:2784255-Pyramimonas_sp.AAC.1